MSIIIPANSAVGGGYDVANGVRFDDGSSSNFTDGSAPGGNRQKFTWSAWFKRSSVGATQILASSSYSGSDEGYLFLSGGGVLGWQSTNGGDGNLGTNMVWRDLSAWYHVVFSVDTTQSTATNRIKLYVNGSQYTWDNSTTQPNVNQSLYFNVGGSYNSYIGRRAGGDYFDGYMSEIVFIDNAQLAADSFGEFDSDSGVWKPLESVEDLTFGTSGYYLNFQNSSALGTDVSGVGNTFTANNLAAIDQTTDTCTNNFATMNPLDNFYYNGVFTEGNLKIINGSGREAGATSTFAISNGKWFWEAKPKSNVAPVIGIQSVPSAANTSSSASMQVNGYGYLKTGKVETSNGSGGSTVLATYATYAADDIIGVAVDLDGNKIYFYKNGALQGSGVTITAASATTNGHYFAGFGVLGGQDTFEVNFGSPPFAISSGNADGNGYGNFEYAVPSGYYALNTKNLAEYG